MRRDLALDAIEQALYDREIDDGQELIHHSDRGVQYVSIGYTERLADAVIELSVGSVGDSYDNAPGETSDEIGKPRFHESGSIEKNTKKVREQRRKSVERSRSGRQ